VQVSKINSSEGYMQYTMKRIEKDLKIEDLAFFKYTPITSVNVERSFSRCKNVFSD